MRIRSTRALHATLLAVWISTSAAVNGDDLPKPRDERPGSESNEWDLERRTDAAGTETDGLPALQGSESSRSPIPLGPLPLRQLDTLSLLFLEPILERADTLPAGSFEWSLDLLHASQEAFSAEGPFVANHDLETTRLALGIGWAPIENLELRLTVPVIHASSGFLDDFIDDFHESTDLGNVFETNFEYADYVRYGGRRIAGIPEDETGLGDIPISVKTSLLREDRGDPLSLAARGTLEIPSGNSDRSLGNGGWDVSIGALAQKTLWDLTAYVSLDGIFAQNPKRFERHGVRVEPANLKAALAIEWRLSSWLAPVAQIELAPALLANGQGDRLERSRSMWAVGAHILVNERTRLRLALVEDFYLGSAPDVTFLLGLSVITP